MFRIVRLRAASPYEVVERVYDSVCVGRSTQNELTTTDRMISSSHARLFVRDTTLQLVDLDSRNGTEVNGERLVAFEPREVRDGDEIDFAGRLAFRVELDHDARWPTISVGTSANPAGADARESILRVLALPGGLTPVLDAGRLLSLQRLILRLTDPTQQRNGGQWLDALTVGAARVLRVPEVLVVRTRPDGTLDVVYPRRPSLEPRADAIAECVRRGQSAAIDVAGDLELDADPQATVDDVSLPESGLIMPTLCGLLRSGPGDVAWGLLYAASPGGTRSFDDQDVWLIDSLSKLVSHLFTQVSASQILALHRGRLPALAEHATALAIVGHSPVLGAALETLAALAREPQPLFLLAAWGTEPERWAELAHRLGNRSGARFVRVDLAASASSTEQLRSVLSEAVQGAQGGTLSLEHLDTVGGDACDVLDAILDAQACRRLRLVTTSSLPPDVLAHPARLGPQLAARLCGAVLRVPGLRERRQDIPTLAAHLLRSHGQPSHDDRVLWTFAEFDYAGELTELRAAVDAVIAAGANHDPSATEQVLAQHLYRTDAAQVATHNTSPQNQVGFHPLADDRQARAPLALTPLADALYQAGLLD